MYAVPRKHGNPELKHLLKENHMSFSLHLIVYSKRGATNIRTLYTILIAYSF